MSRFNRFLGLTWHRSLVRVPSSIAPRCSPHSQKRWIYVEAERLICRTDCSSFLSPSLWHSQCRSSMTMVWWSNLDALENIFRLTVKQLCRRISHPCSSDDRFRAESISNSLYNSASSTRHVRRIRVVFLGDCRRNVSRWAGRRRRERDEVVVRLPKYFYKELGGEKKRCKSRFYLTIR